MADLAAKKIMSSEVPTHDFLDIPTLKMTRTHSASEQIQSKAEMSRQLKQMKQQHINVN